jgi:hypothetical protein
MRLTLPALLLLSCALPLAVNAQINNPNPATKSTSDPEALALVQRALNVLGGGVGLSDLTLSGTAHRTAGSDDETGKATLTTMFPAYSKMSLDFSSGPYSEIRNPATAPLPASIPANSPASAQGTQVVGAWSGSDGVVHPMAPNNLLTEPTWFFPTFTLLRLTNPNYVLTYVGQETLDGQALLHVSAAQQFPWLADAPNGISLLMAHLSQIDVYCDPTTSLPVAIIFDTHPDNNALLDTPTKILFSNYQKTGGVEVPYRVQKYVNNGLVLDLQFSNVTVNSGLTPDQFQVQ